jgi:hypothetical protein
MRGGFIADFQKSFVGGNLARTRKTIGDAYELVAEMHNDLKITEPLPAKVGNFSLVPFSNSPARKFAEAICAVSMTGEVKRIARNQLVAASISLATALTF